MHRCDWRRSISAAVCIVLLVFTSIICTPSTSSADVLQLGLDPSVAGFATTFGGIGGNGNIIDFAALRPNSAFDNTLAANYHPSAGSPPFDPSKWTYLYQVANAGFAPGGVSHTLQSFGFNPVQQSGIRNEATSVGTFGGGNLRFDFTTQGTIVNAQGNNLQGVNNFGIAERLLPSNTLPTNIINVSSSSLPHGSTGLIWNFATNNFTPGAQNIQNGIQQGATSPIFGYQSDQFPASSTNLGPVLNGVIQGFGTIQTVTPLSGVFNVPFGQSLTSSAAPEPSTLLLIGTGALGFVGLCRKRKIQTTT